METFDQSEELVEPEMKWLLQNGILEYDTLQFLLNSYL